MFDPSESEEGIKLPVSLSEVTIPRSGVEFPSSGLVCMSVFQRHCANLEPSPRRLDIPLDSCVEDWGGRASACCETERLTDIPCQEAALISAIMCQDGLSS